MAKKWPFYAQNVGYLNRSEGSTQNKVMVLAERSIVWLRNRANTSFVRYQICRYHLTLCIHVLRHDGAKFWKSWKERGELTFITQIEQIQKAN